MALCENDKMIYNSLIFRDEMRPSLAVFATLEDTGYLIQNHIFHICYLILIVTALVPILVFHPFMSCDVKI